MLKRLDGHSLLIEGELDAPDSLYEKFLERHAAREEAARRVQRAFSKLWHRYDDAYR